MDDVSSIRGAYTYDPETGALTVNKTGRIASGRNRHGYILVQHKGTKFYAHRIAWLLSTGEWPSGQIDHINGDRSDNRRANLRDVSRSENLQNRTKSRNSTGYIGVTYLPKEGLYQARIFAGRSYSLGRFRTAEKAHLAYLEAKKQLHVKNCT